MSAAEDADAEPVCVLIPHRLHDRFGLLPQSRVDHMAAGISQPASDDLHAHGRARRDRPWPARCVVLSPADSSATLLELESKSESHQHDISVVKLFDWIGVTRPDQRDGRGERLSREICSRAVRHALPDVRACHPHQHILNENDPTTILKQSAFNRRCPVCVRRLG